MNKFLYIYIALALLNAAYLGYKRISQNKGLYIGDVFFYILFGFFWPLKIIYLLILGIERIFEIEIVKPKEDKIKEVKDWNGQI
jgi:hypothetical protein